MMRRPFALLCALAISSPLAARPPEQRAPLPSVRAYFAAQREAHAAYEAGDAAAFRKHAEAALRANPGHPPARYLVAAAAALAGDAALALAELEALAALGLVQSPRSERAFAKLLARPEFLALERRFSHNGQPRGRTRLRLATLLPGDFVPESFAFDRARGRTQLASVRQRRIVAVDSRSRATGFVASGEHGLMSALGMHVSGDELLVASAGMPQMRPKDAKLDGTSAVFAFALADGKLRARWPLANATIGDLLVLDARRVLVSDSGNGTLYLLERDSGRWSKLPGGRGASDGSDVFSSPQGMARLDDGRVVFADYSTGLWLADLEALARGAPAQGAHGTIDPAHGYRRLLADPPAALYGIDGLYARDDELVAIQNGTRPQRILRLRLDEARSRIVRVDVLAAARPTWDEPTLGEFDGDDFCFVANSHWPKFDANGELPPASELSPPRIECVAL